MLESYFVSIHDHFNHEPFELLFFPFQSKEKSHDHMGRSEWTRGLFENLDANDRILFGVLIGCFLSSCLFFFFFFFWWGWGRGVVVWEEPTLGLDLKSHIFLMLSRSQTSLK